MFPITRRLLRPGAGRPGWSDPMLDAGPTLSARGLLDPDTYDYKTSFKPNCWRPSPYNRPAPYNSFGGMGPNLPRGMRGTLGRPRDALPGRSSAHFPW